MSNSEIIHYKNSEGNIKIDVRLEDETVWLTQAQMAELFGKDKRTISEHLGNIFKEGDLNEISVVRNFRSTVSDGKNYDTIRLLEKLFYKKIKDIYNTSIDYESKNEEKLLPEYLFLWFLRPEYECYDRFHSWESAHEMFDWSDMCDIKLPFPDIEVQKAIVTIYHALETRKNINEKLKNTQKPLSPMLMRGVVEKGVMA